MLAAGYSVHTVNRGNWYWDSEERVKPDVHHVTCDRDPSAPGEHCPELIDLTNTVDKFEAVIDFSAFGGHEVNQSLKLLSVSTVDL